MTAAKPFTAEEVAERRHYKLDAERRWLATYDAQQTQIRALRIMVRGALEALQGDEPEGET